MRIEKGINAVGPSDRNLWGWGRDGGRDGKEGLIPWQVPGQLSKDCVTLTLPNKTIPEEIISPSF